jgi:hypothetical protein
MSLSGVITQVESARPAVTTSIESEHSTTDFGKPKASRIDPFLQSLNITATLAREAVSLSTNVPYIGGVADVVLKIINIRNVRVLGIGRHRY